MFRSNSVRSSPRADGVNNGPEALVEPCRIRDVWASNLDEAFDEIMHLVKRYNYVAMDTEFPGVLVRPDNNELEPPIYQYELVRDNINMMKLVQLGFSLMDENGQTPPGCSTWQFNFKFNPKKDLSAEGAIHFLTNSGLKLDRHRRDGINPKKFAERCTTSGIVLSDDVKCLVFYGAYDFGYLLRVLTGQKLPQEESEFSELLQIYFPAIYDVKHIITTCHGLWGSLQNVANILQVERVGRQHQAGSDSQLTASVFFKMRELYFRGLMDERFCGLVSGLGGVDFILYGSTYNTTVPVSEFVFPENYKEDETDSDDGDFQEDPSLAETDCNGSS